MFFDMCIVVIPKSFSNFNYEFVIGAPNLLFFPLGHIFLLWITYPCFVISPNCLYMTNTVSRMKHPWFSCAFISRYLEWYITLIQTGIKHLQGWVAAWITPHFHPGFKILRIQPMRCYWLSFSLPGFWLLSTVQLYRILFHVSIQTFPYLSPWQKSSQRELAELLWVLSRFQTATPDNAAIQTHTGLSLLLHSLVTASL